MKKIDPLLTIITLQVFIYLLCNIYFELYFLLIIASVGLIIKSKKIAYNSRIVELALVETWFVSLIFITFYLGHNSFSSYLLILLFVIPQAGLFILASYKVKNYFKTINSSLHLFFLIWLLLQNQSHSITYIEYPILFQPLDNSYYRLFYVVWVIPFLLTGQKYNSLGFIMIQSCSLALSFLHEDFLSMRLFTAQISFVLMPLFNYPLEVETNNYFKTINNLCPLIALPILLYILIVYFR